MPGIKYVKHFTKSASSDSKSEDLHGDPIMEFGIITPWSNLHRQKTKTKFTIYLKKEWKSFH